MWSNARQIAAGDTVIVWLTRDQVQPLVVTPGKDFNTKFGNFRQADFVGVPYGSKVPSRIGKGFVHLLKPTPELWTIALPHRTQILYLADIAFITSHLNIKHGSKVIEAGTGSASFSHSVARTIGSAGKLWSYEFHEARFLKAREEFTRHGMDDIVTIQHRNVCKDGFTVIDEADAVFLDLPAPWDAVVHAKKALRKDRISRICCFSPCMEQVLRTVSALNEAGYTEITMYETLLRPIEVFQAPPSQSVSVVSEKLKKSEIKREEKRLRQIAANKAAHSAKRKREEEEEEKEEDRIPDDDESKVIEIISGGSKRAKTQDENSVKLADPEGGEDQQVELDVSTSTLPMEEFEAEEGNDDDDEIMEDFVVLDPTELSRSLTPPPISFDEDGFDAAPAPTPATPRATSPSKINVSKALPEVRGHTSYLTFACLIPIPTSISAPPPIATIIEEPESHFG